MGKRYVLVDDFDGKELPDTTDALRLTIGSESWDLYLSEKSHNELTKVLAPFTKDAEKTQDTAAAATTSTSAKTTKKAPTAEEKSARNEQRKKIIAFTKTFNEEKKDNQKGFTVPNESRGRIPKELLDLFYGANPDEDRLY